MDMDTAMRTIMMIFCLTMIPGIAFCQERSVLEILDGSGEAIGRGTVVEKSASTDGNGSLGLAITAAHVLDGEPERFGVRFSNGRRAKYCVRLATDAEADIALIQVWVPVEIEAVPVAELQADQDGVWMLGRDGAIRSIRFSISNGAFCFFDSTCCGGESGTGIFQDGKLTGVLSGGWFWLEDGGAIGTTWPLRASRGTRIANLIKENRK